MPAVRWQDRGDLLEGPVGRVGLDEHLRQRGEFAGGVVACGDGVARQTVLGHGLFRMPDARGVPDLRLHPFVAGGVRHRAMNPGELIQMLRRGRRLPGQQ